ncbi:MAG: low-specificity L-threonine aldolase [Bacillota bacterium]
MIDLRSDTVTRPTDEMRRAMAEAEVGDDVYGEDPTVNRLEHLAAEIVGKEAALFFPTGTMANQAAVMTHTRRGDEVLLEAESHIYFYEVGAIAVLSGVIPRLIHGENGVITVEAFASALRPPNIHFPRTRLLCIENTHNRAGGTVMSVEETRALACQAKALGLSIHLDGARIFNAAAALGVDAKELAAPADSVMLCLSKGLSAPAGSMLAGSREFIAEARKNRKILGGGMRQVGVLAAAGIVALTRMRERLVEDHRTARLLAERLAEIPGIRCEPDAVKTNIVMADTKGSAQELVAAMKSAGVLANAVSPRRIRFVTHREVNASDVEEAASRIRQIAGRTG